jgi:HEAT repeat protein
MRGASQRRLATARAEDPAQAIRFAVVVLCVVGTACAYVGCIVLVVGGHLDVLIRLLPWLAATAFGVMLVVILSALLGAGHERLKNRHRLTAERIRVLATQISSLEPRQRVEAKKKLIERLDVTRDALTEILQEDRAVRNRLLELGLASRVERELVGGDKWHRVAAVGVLGLLGAESSLEVLQKALDDRDLDVAYASAQALATYSSPSAYAALLFALTRHRLPPARIVGLLESSPCPAARQLIERRASSENPRVRYWVAYLLGRLGDPRSARVVEELSRDPDVDVRANAAEALAWFPNLTPLRRLIGDESWVVRSHAAKAAGSSGQTELVWELADLLEDQSWWVRQNAMLALASLGDAAVPALLRQLDSEDRFARNKAAEALIRDGYAARQAEILKTGGEGAAEAHRVLVGLGRAEALSTVTNAIRSTREPEAQRRLVLVLQDIGSDQAKSALEEFSGPQPHAVPPPVRDPEPLVQI